MDCHEDWRSVEGFEGLYEVSNYGRVRSVDHYVKCNSGRRLVKGRLLKICDRGNGYAFVTMGKDGRQYNISIHNAVAKAFIPNPNSLPEINHKDCNPMNPRMDNLEWCDREYNNQYDGRAWKSAKKKWKPVAQMLNGKEIDRFECLSRIHDIKGYSIGNISSCCNGKRTSAYGYEWRYI